MKCGKWYVMTSFGDGIAQLTCQNQRQIWDSYRKGIEPSYHSSEGCSLGHQEISFIIPFNRFPSNYGSVHHKVVWLIGDKSDLGWLEYRKMGQKHEWDRLDAIFGLDEKDFFG